MAETPHEEGVLGKVYLLGATQGGERMVETDPAAPDPECHLEVCP